MVSVYYSLRNRLRQQSAAEVTLTFSQIEKILDRRLPRTALDRDQWWENNPIGHVPAAAWLDAGFTAHPDRADKSVTFTRR